MEIACLQLQYTSTLTTREQCDQCDPPITFHMIQEYSLLLPAAPTPSSRLIVCYKFYGPCLQAPTPTPRTHSLLAPSYRSLRRRRRLVYSRVST